MQAIDYLHERGIAHRDLKPENILLTRSCVPKIGDFGLVKHTKKGLNMEKFKTKCGTLGFMAPEMLSRASYDGQSTDIFALGVILFIMITGRPPFREAGD
jgi:serine/threonine protein kinase